jgi:hypothetical protein
MLRALALSLLLAAVVLFACQQVPGRGDYEFRCSFIDTETGERVSRRDLWVEVHNDGSEVDVEIERAVASTFIVRMPEPEVRLRIGDYTDRYREYETTLLVPPTGLDHVVRLIPTHFVLLKGRLLERERGAWVPMRLPPNDGMLHGWPQLHLDLDDEQLDSESAQPRASWSISPKDDSSFELRLPRKRLRLDGAINTALAPETPVLDLTEFVGDVLQLDIHMVP